MEAGGSERQLLYLLQGIDRARFTPILYLLYPRGALLGDVPADVPIASFWKDRPAPRWNWPGRIHRWQVEHLVATLREQQIDLVYDRLFHMTLITGPASCRAQVRRISSIVSPPEFDLERTERRWLWWKRRALARTYRQSDGLVTVSVGTAQSAARYYGIPPSQFQVIPSPIDIERIDRMAALPASIAPGAALPGSVTREPNTSPREILPRKILAVGRLSQEKGHRDLIDAFAFYQRDALAAGHPDAELHLAGDGPLRSTLQAHVDALGLESKVIFHGQVANPYALMGCCDLFVMPSHYEGMPNAMLEAMACSAPVLATDTASGAGELLRAHPLGSLVPIGDAQAMAAAIADRFRREGHWLERAQQARKYVVQHHGLRQWLERMHSLFESTLSR
jgi:glycosyltransferase involved in cell wall biosynthesis